MEVPGTSLSDQVKSRELGDGRREVDVLGTSLSCQVESR